MSGKTAPEWKKKEHAVASLKDEFDQLSREAVRTGIGNRVLEALKRRRESASKPADDWAGWAAAQATGAVRRVLSEIIIEELRRDPPDQQLLAEMADELEEILSEIFGDDAAKVPDPKQERRERRRFEAGLVQHDVDALAARLGRCGVPNPVEQALQTVALEREETININKTDPFFTANPEGKAKLGKKLDKWLRRNR